MPTIYGFREFVEAGGLISYGANLPAVYRRFGVMIDKIIKGATASDVPVEVPTRFELIINLKTAKSIGMAIPETFLLRADEVIE